MSTATSYQHQLKATTDESGVRESVTLPIDVLEQFVHMLELKEGWDTYRAPSPKAVVVGRAIEFLQVHYAKLLAKRAKYDLAPSLDGGVDISVSVGERWLALVFANDGSVRVERSDGVEREGPDGPDEHVDWLTRS